MGHRWGCIGFCTTANKETKDSWGYEFERNPTVLSVCTTARGLCVLDEMHHESAPTFAGKLQLVVNPSAARAVRAFTPIAQRALQLVPFSPSLTCTKPGESAPRTCVDLGYAYTDQGTQKDVVVYVCPKVQPLGSGKYEMLVPFWLVDTMVEASKANVQLRLVESKMDERWSVPCLVNHKALKAGDTLAMLVKPGRGKYPPFTELEDTDDASRKRRKVTRS